MKRFFYFGCSFTHFGWPTWGDMIAIDLMNHHGFHEAYNYGRGGACNTFILNQLNDCIDKHNITDDDMVAVSWTTVHRQSWLGVDLNTVDHMNDGLIHWHTSGEYQQNYLIDSLPIKEKQLYAWGVYSTLQARSMFHKLVKPNYEMRLTHRPFRDDDEQLGNKVKFDKAVGGYKFADYYYDFESVQRERFQEFADLPRWKCELKNTDRDDRAKRIPENYNYHPDWLVSEYVPGHPDPTMHFEMAKQFHDFHPDTAKLVEHFHESLVNDWKKVAKKNPTNAKEFRQIYNKLEDKFWWPEKSIEYGLQCGSPQH